MTREEYTYTSTDIDFGTFKEILKHELESNSPYSVEVRERKRGATMESSHNLVNVNHRGDKIDFTIDAKDHIHDAITEAVRSQGSGKVLVAGVTEEEMDRSVGTVDQSIVETDDSRVSDSNSGGIDTGVDPMGGARPTGLLPDDATLQATMRLYENGMLVVETGGSKEMYETAAGVFLASGNNRGNQDLEIAEAYTIDDFGMRYSRRDIQRAIREIEKTLEDM